MNIDYFHPILLKVGKAQHNGDWNWKNVKSPFFRIYYVVEGDAAIEIEGTLYQLRQNDICVVPPFALHSTFCPGRFVHYYVHLYNNDIEHEDIFSEYKIPVCFRGDEEKRMLFEKIVVLNSDLSLAESNPITYDNNHGLQESIMQSSQKSFLTHLETRSMVYLIILEILKHSVRCTTHHDLRIQKVLQYISKNLSGNLTTESLASIACLSTEHFIRLFKKSVNCTPIRYVNTKRIERAQMLLVTSNLPISHVASEVGFHELPYFVHSFKKQTGLTPSRYREQIKR